MDDLLKLEFIAEVEEMLDTCTNILIKLESKSLDSNSPEMREILRCLHSAKGGCSMFDMKELSHGFHYAEDLLQEWSNSSAVPNNGIDYLLSFIDQAKVGLKNFNSSFLFEKFRSDLKPTPVETSSPSPMVKPQAGEESSNLKRKNIFLKAIEDIKTGASTPGKMDEEYFAYIIDDEKDIRDHITKRLRAAGFITKSFINPIKALEDIDTDHPDVIVTDFSMPEMNGKEFLQAIKERKIQIPLIFVSAYLTKEMCIDLLTLGAAGFVEKPFKIDDLIKMASLNAKRYQTSRLLDRSISHLIYQLSYLDSPSNTFMTQDQIKGMKDEIKLIMRFRKKITQL